MAEVKNTSRHSYGCIHDPLDLRDFHFSVAAPRTLPPSVDLRRWCSPVRDQGQLGSCTGFAVEALREFIFRKTDLTTLSPLFIYYEERVLENTVKYDAGATIRSGMKVLNKQGVCPEIDWPYTIVKYKKAPTKTAVKHALKYKIAAYSRVQVTALDIKNALSLGNGVVLGFDVYESFESEAVATTGIMPMPKQGEALLGGHAVFACGYVDNPAFAGGGYFIVKNSWGHGWGSFGYFQMPYAATVYMADLWTASN